MLLAAAGCSREQGGTPYVARVDGEQLTSAEMRTLRGARGDSLGDADSFVNDWVATELLYQEAQRRGLASSEEITQQLVQLRKRLAVAALLDQEIYTNDTTAVNEDAIVTYYRTAGTAFTLREDVARISYVLFRTRDAANAFRSQVLRGTAWDDGLARLLRDTLRATPVQVVPARYATASALYPEELWKVARTLAKGDVSFVITTPAGFAVLKLLGLKHQGELADLDYVRGDVRDRILIEARRLRYERLLASLRSQHAIEVHLERADTGATE